MRKSYALDRASEVNSSPEEPAGYQCIARSVNSMDGTRSLYSTSTKVSIARASAAPGILTPGHPDRC